MVPLNMSANQLAIRLHVPTGRVTQIINGQRSISADSALRLSRYFGTTPQFWLNLQSRYDLQVAQDKAGEVVAETIIPYELETKKEK